MIDYLTDFHFIRPMLLLLLPLVIALWWVWQRRADPLRGWREQMDADLMGALVVGDRTLRRGPALWVLGGWLLAVIAISGPTWRLEPSPFADDATPLMILLKSDATMDRPDPSPSRMERAKLKVTDLAEARKGQPLGLVAYAGSAHLVLPPTRDTLAVGEMASEISPEIMPVPGDRLDLAVRKASEVLGEEGGVLLVMADGIGGDLDKAAKAVGESGLSVLILSINSPGSGEEGALRDAAKVMGATMVGLTHDGADVEEVIRRAARAPRSRAGELGNRWQETGWWLVPVLALIVAFSFRRESSGKEVLA